MPGGDGHAWTRDQWRALGFFYERDEVARTWRLVGSRAGLGRFCELLRRFAASPRSGRLFEHDHHGPYGYLKIQALPEARLDGLAIGGRPEQFAGLAATLEGLLAGATPGQTIELGPAFAPSSAFGLEVRVAGDGFDPAGADPLLPPEPATPR